MEIQEVSSSFVIHCLRYGKQTMSGIIKDGISALSRYYLNNFQDGVRQVRHVVLFLILFSSLIIIPGFFSYSYLFYSFCY